MRHLNYLLLSCLTLIVLSVIPNTHEVTASMAPRYGWVKLWTSTGGGGVTLNKTGWPTSNQTWTVTMPSGSAGACIAFPRSTPFNVTAFEPKGYPFVRWVTSGYIRIANSSSNPTNVTLTNCPDFDNGNTYASITAVFNGPADSLPTNGTLLLIFMLASTTLIAKVSGRGQSKRNPHSRRLAQGLHPLSWILADSRP